MYHTAVQAAALDLERGIIAPHGRAASGVGGRENSASLGIVQSDHARTVGPGDRDVQTMRVIAVVKHDYDLLVVE
jgi:hypothetical protein